MKKLPLLLVCLLLLPAALAMAGGAGGVGFSGQYFHPTLSSADLGMTSLAGFGYGVGSDGSRVGGFGAAFFSASGDAAGGVGGGGWAGNGYMLAYGAAHAELGFWVLPWMQLSAYVGYEALGNVLPGVPFSRAFLRTPVLGMRISWGSQ